MDMYNFNTGQPSSEFPLDIAMKIFWEAETITVDATVTGAGTITVIENDQQVTQEVIETRTTVKTFDWGGVFYEPGTFIAFDPPNRPPFADAKSALCRLSDRVNFGTQVVDGFHTQYFGFFSAGDYDANMDVLFRQTPILLNGRLIAPFEVRCSIRVPLNESQVALGTILTQPRRLIGESPGFTQELSNSCLWITPLGNVNTPLYGVNTGTFDRPFLSTGSMTITVTGADPAVRYA
jgi:hypothetical protein